MKKKPKRKSKGKAKTKKRRTPRTLMLKRLSRSGRRIKRRRGPGRVFKRKARAGSRRKSAGKVFKRESNPYTDYKSPVLPTLSREATNDLDAPRRSFPTPRQGTRLIKIECIKCGYTARVTNIWIEGGWHKAKGKHVDGGLPTCHCGGKFKVKGDEKRHTPDVPGQMVAW